MISSDHQHRDQHEERYAFLLLLISFNNCIKVLVGELGEPVLVFNVYNRTRRSSSRTFRDRNWYSMRMPCSSQIRDASAGDHDCGDAV